ncbi:MAG: carboxypeptidase-like regulatory domain-containing protein, partial [Bacteroidaceae bacterium]|nr:carboxypeptidase-like regulatory domain-containing protein [Bacteroidaceae bacterium]
LITYKNQGGVTYLNYVRNDLRFKCSWKKKLFSTTYNITSEMVVTNRQEGQVDVIPRKESFKMNDIFSDKVDNFENDDFWGAYNIIQPTESLEHAVDKLKKQRK